MNVLERMKRGGSSRENHVFPEDLFKCLETRIDKIVEEQNTIMEKNFKHQTSDSVSDVQAKFDKDTISATSQSITMEEQSMLIRSTVGELICTLSSSSLSCYRKITQTPTGSSRYRFPTERQHGKWNLWKIRHLSVHVSVQHKTRHGQFVRAIAGHVDVSMLQRTALQQRFIIRKKMQENQEG